MIGGIMTSNYNVKIFTFEKYHAKKNVGSTKLRVHNLIKNWPEASLYNYGERADVLIFQKVYVQPDYDFPITYPFIKILDVCDPDWLEDMPIKQTVDAVDAVTVPTKALADFIKQMTDKPVRVIKDRFDLTEFPSKVKTHQGKAKKLVWFGYSHNARKLKGAMNAIIDLDLSITIISNKDPSLLGWAESIKMKKENYEFINYDPDTVYYDLSNFDIAVLPEGGEPVDRFKSENKDIIANLCGLPVAKTRDELEKFIDPQERNKEVEEKHAIALSDYDVKLSVKEMRELINEIRANGR